MTVVLPSEIYPDENVKICLDYTITLANINHRLGYGENTINFGNFYPIVCVYENGFVENKFVSNGDPFYSDIANYNVQITYNEKYTMASSGDVIDEKIENGRKTTSVKGEKLRDFCFVLSEKFQKTSNTVDGVTVNYYYYDDENYEDNLTLSCQVLQEFSNMFGEYPYKTLNVVKTSFALAVWSIKPCLHFGCGYR